MATLKERSDNWNATSITSRDHRHDKGDGYEETPHKSKHGKKKVRPKKKGCPANNGRAHVYIWVPLRFAPDVNGHQTDRAARKPYGYTVYPWMSWQQEIDYLESHESRVCCGCYHVYDTRRKA